MSDIRSYQAVEKLKGRENYHTWKIAMQAYLESEELWDTIEAPTEGTLTTDAKKNIKSKAKMLSMNSLLYTYLEGTSTAIEVWNALKKAFADDGLSHRVNLLIKFTSTKLTESRSVEEYVNKITTCAQKLNGAGMSVPDE